jgi:hypothetical protein
LNTKGLFFIKIKMEVVKDKNILIAGATDDIGSVTYTKERTLR